MPFCAWRWAGAMALARRDKALGSAVARARHCLYFCLDCEERAMTAPWRSLAQRYASAMALARRWGFELRVTVRNL